MSALIVACLLVYMEGYIHNFSPQGSPGFIFVRIPLLSFDTCFTCMAPVHLFDIPSVCLLLCELSFLFVLNVAS